MRGALHQLPPPPLRPHGVVLRRRDNLTTTVGLLRKRIIPDQSQLRCIEVQETNTR